MAVRQALVMIEAVEHTWSRELGLDRSELMVLLQVARRPGYSTTWIPFLSGIRRQNVWRAMKSLQKRGVVHPTYATGRGAEAWSLTDEGVVLARRLEARLATWESMLNETVDLVDVASSLRRMVERLVNRPRGGDWRKGLVVPEEARADSDWDLHLHNAVLPGIEVPPLGPIAERRHRRADKARADLEAAWSRLWR